MSTRFDFAATDVDGNTVKDSIQASTESEARRRLLLANLDVRTIAPHRSRWSVHVGREPRVKPVDVLHMSRQLSAFLHAGLTLVDGLSLIARSAANPTLGRALEDVRDQVREGTPFEDALATHANLFPRYYLGVIRSAGLTGRLDVTLDELATYMERELEARSRIRSALAYPAVIVAMSVVSVVVLTAWVIPRFIELFDQLDAELPLSTRMLMGIAESVQRFWFLYLLGAAALIGFVMWMRRSETGRRWKDHLFFRLPVIGEIVLFSGVERVCRILAALWSAGVPIGDAMDAAIQSADNAVFTERLTPVREAVLSGEGLAGPIEASDLFPDAAVQMIAVGEATGTMAEQLDHAADFYGRELAVKLRRLTTYFEPLVIVVVGVVVGFVAIALVQAMYGSLNGGALQP